MKLICLGTSGYQPSETRHTSCYMIPEIGVLLDAGTGMFRARKFLGQRYLDILLTHAHLDHIVGLTFVLGWRELHGLESIHVYGKREKLEQIQEHLFSDHLFPVRPPIEWRPLPEQTSDRSSSDQESGGLGTRGLGGGEVCLRSGARIRWWEQTHPGGSLGYRLDYGSHSLGYVTDTTARSSDPYLAELHKVRLLIHECNFDDKHSEMAALTGHSWLAEVLQRARDCQVEKLALVHTNPYDSAQKVLAVGEGSRQGFEVVIPSDLDELTF